MGGGFINNSDGFYKNPAYGGQISEFVNASPLTKFQGNFNNFSDEYNDFQSQLLGYQAKKTFKENPEKLANLNKLTKE